MVAYGEVVPGLVVRMLNYLYCSLINSVLPKSLVNQPPPNAIKGSREVKRKGHTPLTLLSRDSRLLSKSVTVALRSISSTSPRVCKLREVLQQRAKRLQ